MLGYVPVGRRAGGSAVREVFIWILLGVAAAAATLGFIFAVLAFNREGFDDSGLLAAIASLQGCCDAVSAGISSLLTSMSTVLTDLSTVISLVTSVSENNICQPIFAIPAGGVIITTPGCWIVQNDLACSLTATACITVASNGVTIFGSGFDLALGPNTSGIVAAYSPKFKLSDMRIINEPPSNYPANVGLTIYDSSDVTVEKVTFNGSCNGALVYDSDALLIDGCLFTEIKHINATSAPNNNVWPLQVNGGNGVSLVNTDFVHVDGTVAPTANFSSYIADNAFAFFKSPTTQLAVQGVNIKNVNVIDGAYVWLAPIGGGTVDNLNVVVENPNSIYSIMEITYGPPPYTESLTVKNSHFRNDNTYPIADGVLCNRCRAVTFDNVDIATNGYGVLPYNPAATGPVYAFFAASLHLNTAFGSSYDHTQSNPGTTMVGSGFILKNSHLSGATTSQATQQQGIGLLVGGNQEQTHVIDTVFENFGGYIPANATAGVPQVPGGAIVVTPGNRGVRISGCKIYGSANGSPQGGNGILFMGAMNVTVIPVYGSGTSIWPAASNCTAINNQIFDNAGYAILDQGAGTTLFGNVQAGNWAGGYSSVNSPVVVAPGAPALAGQNI